MFSSHSPAIYEFLRDQRIVGQSQLDELNEEHKATGKPLADVVVDLGLVEKSSLLRQIAAHLGYDYVAELPVQFPGEAIAAVSGKLARDYGVSIEIASGLADGATVVINPSTELVDGGAVRVAKVAGADRAEGSALPSAAVAGAAKR